MITVILVRGVWHVINTIDGALMCQLGTPDWDLIPEAEDWRLVHELDDTLCHACLIACGAADAGLQGGGYV